MPWSAGAFFSGPWPSVSTGSGTGPSTPMSVSTSVHLRFRSGSSPWHGGSAWELLVITGSLALRWSQDSASQDDTSLSPSLGLISRDDNTGLPGVDAPSEISLVRLGGVARYPSIVPKTCVSPARRSGVSAGGATGGVQGCAAQLFFASGAGVPDSELPVLLGRFWTVSVLSKHGNNPKICDSAAATVWSLQDKTC